MNVTDMALEGKTVSRLVLARAAAARTLSRLPCGSSIGWSIFAEHRTFPLLLPLEVCANYESLLSTLEKIDGKIRWRDSSSVGKGIYWAVRNSSQSPGSHIVFLSDGHEAPPKRAGQRLLPELETELVRGWIVGVGSDRANRIPKADSQGRISGYWQADDVVQQTGVATGQSQEHLSALREEHLKAIAKEIGLGYHRLTSPASLSNAMMDNSLSTRQSIPTDVRWMPALMALLLLCWNFLPKRL